MPRLLFILLLLFWVTVRAEAQPVPKAGEIRLEGIIAAVAPDKTSFNLEVSSFTLPTGKSTTLKVPKIRKIGLDATSQIFPGGDTNWKLLAQSLRVGYEAQAVGSEGEPFAARAVELQREIEGKRVDYFVAQNGSDAADGSAKSPWRTVQKAVTLMPSGWVDESCVLHIGPGSFAESYDGKSGQLRIDDKKNVILTGASARVEGGTQIQTGDYAKTANVDMLRVSNCQNLEIRNLVLGDDKSWDQDRFFEATVKLTRASKVLLQNVRIVGPTWDTLVDSDRKRAPTALRPDDAESTATLQNVLITGHGSFLSNPEGRVFCSRVTFAHMSGPGYDDHFLFLQTPQRTTPNERRFTFENCLIYEMAGGRGGDHFMMAGRDGEDKVYFDPPKDGQGGNILVRCRYGKPNTPFDTKTLPGIFTELRDGHFARIHGVFVNDDINGALAGGLTVNNDIQLEKRDGYILTASKSLRSGWTGGYSSPAQP